MPKNKLKNPFFSTTTKTKPTLFKPLSKLEQQQLQHRSQFPDGTPVYTYSDLNLTEVRPNTLINSEELKSAILLANGCDIDLGTLQVWVHAGIKNIFLIDCQIASSRWRSSLPIIATPINNQPIPDYPCIQLINCVIKDEISLELLTGYTFNSYITGASLSSFAFNLEPEPRPTSRCWVDALFDGCVLGKDGIIKTEDNNDELPPSQLATKLSM